MIRIAQGRQDLLEKDSSRPIGKEGGVYACEVSMDVTAKELVLFLVCTKS